MWCTWLVSVLPTLCVCSQQPSVHSLAIEKGWLLLLFCAPSAPCPVPVLPLRLDSIWPSFCMPMPGVWQGGVGLLATHHTVPPGRQGPAEASLSLGIFESYTNPHPSPPLFSFTSLNPLTLLLHALPKGPPGPQLHAPTGNAWHFQTTSPVQSAAIARGAAPHG